MNLGTKVALAGAGAYCIFSLGMFFQYLEDKKDSPPPPETVHQAASIKVSRDVEDNNSSIAHHWAQKIDYQQFIGEEDRMLLATFLVLKDEGILTTCIHLKENGIGPFYEAHFADGSIIKAEGEITEATDWRSIIRGFSVIGFTDEPKC